MAIVPRLVDQKTLALYLGIKESTMSQKMVSLEKLGFPERVAPFNMFDLRAVDQWLDARSKIGQAPDRGNMGGVKHGGF